MNQKANPSRNNDLLDRGRVDIKKLYLTDLSFEVPNSLFELVGDSKPTVDIKILNRNKRVNKNQYEVSLRVTVTVTQAERTAYTVVAEQSGLFLIAGFDDSVLEAILSIECLNILFPYVREVVSDLVTKGGFPQLVLAPVNFAFLFKKAKHSADSQQTG